MDHHRLRPHLYPLAANIFLPMSTAFVAPAHLLPASPFTPSLRPLNPTFLTHRTPTPTRPSTPLNPTLCLPPDDPHPVPDSPPPNPNPKQPPSPSPSPSPISFSTAASSAPTLSAALTDAASRALANLTPGGPPTLAFVFVSARYCVPQVGPSGRDSLSLVVPKLRALVPQLQAVLGCTADGVIGMGPTQETVEIDNGPGLSLTLARFPRILVKTFHVMPDDIPSLDASQPAWQRIVGNPHTASGNPAFIILSDPAFAERGDLERFLSGLEYAYPGCSVVGSLASAAAAMPQGHLFCTLPRDVLSSDSSSLRDSGVVGISLTGDVQVDCLVSAGCRGIGPVYEVRKVSPGNVVLEMELVGRPSSLLSAAGCLKGLVAYATPGERRLIENELCLGIVVEDDRGNGDDYMIRHVIGVDGKEGGIAVAGKVRPGQRVRFFVKEAKTAADNLDSTMQKYKRIELANSLVGYSNPPFGAMVFVDSGRDRSMLREPSIETRNLSSFAKGVPVAGFFGGGQIGPCRTGEDGLNSPSVLHNAANLIALVRRRSGMSPVEPVDSPSISKADLDDKKKE